MYIMSKLASAYTWKVFMLRFLLYVKILCLFQIHSAHDIECNLWHKQGHPRVHSAHIILNNQTYISGHKLQHVKLGVL